MFVGLVKQSDFIKSASFHAIIYAEVLIFVEVFDGFISNDSLTLWNCHYAGDEEEPGSNDINQMLFSAIVQSNWIIPMSSWNSISHNW